MHGSNSFTRSDALGFKARNEQPHSGDTMDFMCKAVEVTLCGFIHYAGRKHSTPGC